MNVLNFVMNYYFYYCYTIALFYYYKVEASVYEIKYNNIIVSKIK